MPGDKGRATAARCMETTSDASRTSRLSSSTMSTQDSLSSKSPSSKGKAKQITSSYTTTNAECDIPVPSPSRRTNARSAMEANFCRDEEEVRQMFVYGTLRPDDDSGSDCHASFQRRVDRARKANLSDAALIICGYPAVLLDANPEGPGVTGYVMGCDSRAAWASQLKMADNIENYGKPGGHQRKVVLVTANGREERAWVYHRTGEAECKNAIASGDWLDRDRRH